MRIGSPDGRESGHAEARPTLWGDSTLGMEEGQDDRRYVRRPDASRNARTSGRMRVTAAVDLPVLVCPLPVRYLYGCRTTLV